MHDARALWRILHHKPGLVYHVMDHMSHFSIRETVVEQEEAEAEVAFEKNQKMKEVKSKEEIKNAELEHIKREV